MSPKGTSTTLKRKPAPRFWPIHRKEFTWAVKPSQGPHSREGCLPLAIVLRDSLQFAKTRKEAKIIVSQGRIYVDRIRQREDDFPIGLWDVISIPDANQNFRLLPSAKGLVFHSIDEEEAKFKLCRIDNKRTVENGNIQLNLHDGSNILVKVADQKNPQEDVYETLNTVKISLPEKHILEHIKMKERNFAIITGGKNIGKHGRIVEIEKAEGKKRSNILATIEDEKGTRYQTILRFVFATGEAQPLITLPEVAPIV